MAESFVDFLEAYGKVHPPEMVLREGGDFAEWQGRFRAQVEGLRGPLPDRVEPEVEVVEEVQAEGHKRLLLRFGVSDVSTMAAYLLVPDDLSEGEQRPGLIVSHGHVKYGMDSMCGVQGLAEGDGARRAYALSAVEAGYAGLAPAWWGWVGRDGHADRVGGRDKCNVIQMAAGMYGINVTDLHIQDGQACVDVLAGRSEVDEGRIGCIGNSYGGRTTMWLTIFEDRIKACVPSGCMNTFRERSLKLGSCGIQYLPGILRYGDVPELFCLIAPRPMQLQAGEGDGLITDTDRDGMVETVGRAYRALGCEDRFDYVLHSDGHLLRWDLAAPFLKRHL